MAVDAVATFGINYGGVLELGGPDAPRWRVTEDGWDEGRVKYLVRGATVDPADYFARGEAHDRWSRMRVVDSDWLEDGAGPLGDDCWEVSVTYRGLLTRRSGYSKAYKRRIFNHTQTSSGNAIASTEWTGYQKAEVKEGLISVRDQFVTEAEPSTTLVSKAVTPPDAPGVPTSPFSSLTDAQSVFLYPPGWVLESREIDQIEGASVWFVVDTYVFYNDVKPGDV